MTHMCTVETRNKISKSIQWINGDMATNNKTTMTKESVNIERNS